MMRDERGIILPIERLYDINVDDFEKTTQKKGRDYITYYETVASYDIETSSFRTTEGIATTITYAHIFSIDGYVFKCETWDQAMNVFNRLRILFNLDYFNRLIVYVHNLSYEFQFMKRHFEFARVFNNGGDRKVLTAETNDGIEFRCSYMLSSSSLAQVAKNLQHHTVKKMNGDLDYSLVRTPLTKISKKEEQYMINDVVIIDNYIRECIQEEGGITKIPLTNTGRVRKYTKDETITPDKKDEKLNRKKRNYRELMKQLTLQSDEYNALRHAFAGGFTHANVMNAKKVKEDVTARDFASSYPARMISYQYPMGKGEEYTVRNKKEFFEQLSEYCCLFYIRLEGLNRIANEAYLSDSKAIRKNHVTVNNGRIESASYVELWMTDVDMRSVMLSYDIDDFQVFKMYRYKRGYLPTLLVNAIIKLYEDKTILKGVKGREADYNRAKALLNSLYGMCVQDIVQDDFDWDDILKESIREPSDVDYKISKYNSSRKRFLSYPWGVWITAYARHDLFKDVVQLGDDYVYCDTDSIYYTNEDKHEDLFKQSNDEIIRQLKAAADHHGIDFDRLSPKDPKGESHTIGLWDLDGRYKRFKTLGAKRYMIEDYDGNINITVSGINKSIAVPFLIDKYGENIFEAFDEHLHVPEGACGKSTHTYIDSERNGSVIDYQGAEYTYSELSAVHLEETSYSMTISNEYSEMIEYLQNERPLSR